MADRTLTVRLRAVTTEYNAAMAAAGRSTAGLGTTAEASMAKASGSTQALVGKLGGLKGALGQVAATGIGVGIVSSLDAAGDAFAKAGRETLKFKRITGATAEDASRLRVVAQQTGTDVDKLAGAFVKLSKTQDTSKGQAALAALGVSLKDANGEALPLPDQLKAIAEGFANTGDAATRNRAVVDLFGRSGADLGPLLSKGAAGIDELIRKSDELGLTLGEDDLASVKKYTQAQRDMSLAWQGFQIQVGSEVLPVLADGLEKAAGFASSAAQAFAGLPDPVKQGSVALAGLSGSALVLFGGGGLMLRGLASATQGWRSFAGGIGSARGALASLNLRDAEGNLTRLGAAARAAAAAGTAIAVGFALDQLGKSDTKEYFDELATTSETSTQDVIANLYAAGQASKGFTDTLFDISPAIIKFADGTGASLSEIDRGLGDAYKSNNLDALRKGITALKDVADDPINAPIKEDILRVVDDYQHKLDVTSKAQEKTGDTAVAAAPKLTTLEDVMRVLDAQVSQLTSSYESNQAAVKGWSEGIAQTSGLYNNATDSAQGLGAAWTQLREVGGSLPAKIDLAAIAQGKYTDEQNKAIDAWQQLGTAVQSQLQTQLSFGVATDQVRASAAAYEQQLRSQLTQMGITDQAAQDYYITLAGLDGKSVETAITLSGAEQARQQLQILQGNFDSLPPEKRSEIYAKIAQNDWTGAKAVYDSIQNKTVQIEMQTRYTSQGVTADATAKRQGRVPGEVYRASGGSIPFSFRPKGTDTVPAMLTPGEFVVSTKGVQAAGLPLLQAINSGRRVEPQRFAGGGLVDGLAKISAAVDAGESLYVPYDKYRELLRNARRDGWGVEDFEDYSARLRLPDGRVMGVVAWGVGSESEQRRRKGEEQRARWANWSPGGFRDDGGMERIRPVAGGQRRLRVPDGDAGTEMFRRLRAMGMDTDYTNKVWRLNGLEIGRARDEWAGFDVTTTNQLARAAMKSAGAVFLAGGGFVPGAGSGDRTPAMLTPGEFVLRKAAADRLGGSFLERLNAGSGRNLIDDKSVQFGLGGAVAQPAATGVSVAPIAGEVANLRVALDEMVDRVARPLYGHYHVHGVDNPESPEQRQRDGRRAAALLDF